MIYFRFKRSRTMVTVVVLREVYIKEVPEVDMDGAMDEDMEEGEVEPTLFFNCGDIFHVSRFSTKQHSFFRYCYKPEHVTENFPKLLNKWEEKKKHCNMLTIETRGNKKKDDEVDL
jgi:hypothetical protein